MAMAVNSGEMGKWKEWKREKGKGKKEEEEKEKEEEKERKEKKNGPNPTLLYHSDGHNFRWICQ